jgi:hypothetical protein
MKSATHLRHPRLCRRQLLEVGAIGMLGLSTSDVARSQSAAVCDDNSPGRRNPQKVVYVFLPGGPPQHETFDLKSEAPDTIRGEFGAIATRTPGLLINEHLPLLAGRSEKFTILRSLHHHSNDHIAGTTIMTSGDSRIPSLTPANKEPSVEDTPGIATLAGYYRPGENHVPGSAVIPEYIGRGTGTGQIVPGQTAGRLGAAGDPWLVRAASNCLGWGACPHCFDDGDDDAVFAFGLEHRHTGPAFRAPSLRLPDALTSQRLAGRLSLLETYEQGRRALDQLAERSSLDRFRQQAVSLLTSAAVRRALDLKNEDDARLDAYGRNKFGWPLLLARRLLEAGVNMIQVSLGRNGTWDTHRRAFPLLKDYLLPPTDRAMSAFLDDLDERGLLAETLVVMCGEFGRTPRLSAPPGRQPGRDHWGPVQSVLVAGGGVAGGRVVVASDKIGGYVKHTPKTPEDLESAKYLFPGTSIRGYKSSEHRPER